MAIGYQPDRCQNQQGEAQVNVLAFAEIGDAGVSHPIAPKRVMHRRHQEAGQVGGISLSKATALHPEIPFSPHIRQHGRQQRRDAKDEEKGQHEQIAKSEDNFPRRD